MRAEGVSCGTGTEMVDMARRVTKVVSEHEDWRGLSDRRAATIAHSLADQVSDRMPTRALKRIATSLERRAEDAIRAERNRKVLRLLPGKTITAKAQAARISRQGFYKWLRGFPISPKYAVRIAGLTGIPSKDITGDHPP